MVQQLPRKACALEFNSQNPRWNQKTDSQIFSSDLYTGATVHMCPQSYIYIIINKFRVCWGKGYDNKLYTVQLRVDLCTWDSWLQRMPTQWLVRHYLKLSQKLIISQTYRHHFSFGLSTKTIQLVCVHVLCAYLRAHTHTPEAHTVSNVYSNVSNTHTPVDP